MRARPGLQDVGRRRQEKDSFQGADMRAGMIACAMLALGSAPQGAGLAVPSVPVRGRAPAPVMPERVWRPRAEAHRRRVLDTLEEGFMQEEPIRRRREERTSGDGFRRLNPGHAVFNFLHDYYNIRGAKGARRLGRWSPGLSWVTLAGATGEDVDRGTLSPVACEVHAGGVTYDAAQHFASAAPSAATPYLWYHDVLAATEAAEPVLHCYCLHEWAMQYWPEVSVRACSACAVKLLLECVLRGSACAGATCLHTLPNHTHTHTHTHTHVCALIRRRKRP